LDLDQSKNWAELPCSAREILLETLPKGPNIIVEHRSSVQRSGHSSSAKGDGDSPEHEVLEGQVFSVVFAAEESGFAVVVLESPDGAQTAAGELGEVHPGDFLRLHGRWSDHPRFGRQFQAQWSEQTTPTTLEGLEKYLASGSFPGIGADMSRRLIDHFGEHTLEALEHGAKSLQAVQGIGPKRATVLAEAFAQGRARHRVLAELRGLGLKPGQAQKLYEKWQANAIEKVKADPYALIGELRGIGFETAEIMARKLGIPVDSVVRARGVVLHLLREGNREGHTCLPESVLDEKLRGLGVPAERITEALVELIRSKRVVCDQADVGEAGQGWYFLPLVYDDEVAVAVHIHRLLGQIPEAAADSDTVMKAIRRAPLEPDASQLRAVKMALTESCSVLTGGPGTGKTTCLRLLLDILEAAGVGPICLASPTGRAAKRLHEATGREAGTVHRLLGWDPGSYAWRHDQETPLDAAYLIVDEVSMLDVFVAAALLRAVPDGCRILLVGDADQLPSVSAGAVLRDLVECERVPTTRLERVHRQGQGSGIVDAAHRILHGQLPETYTSTAGDFFLSTPANDEAAAEQIERIVCDRIPAKYGFDSRSEVLVLSPMYRGPLGVDALNQRLSNRLNPDGEGAPWSNGLRTGDKVMVVRNDYEREVFNGDTGMISHISNDELFVEIDNVVQTYGREEINDLIPAYCVTVHRSQGSEARAVVVALSGSHYLMLRRNLLYTAVTRGKNLVTVVCNQQALWRAVNNADESRRYTRLGPRLLEC
jgi:exodeoxyribonuclease V alpha subunit